MDSMFTELWPLNLVTWMPIIIHDFMPVPGEFEFTTATNVFFTSQALLHPIVETVLKFANHKRRLAMLLINYTAV